MRGCVAAVARQRGDGVVTPAGARPASTSVPAPTNLSAEGHTQKINERKQDEDEDGDGVS